MKTKWKRNNAQNVIVLQKFIQYANAKRAKKGS